MRTLKDVYIKVTEQNQDELGKILYINKPTIGYNISFGSDSLDNVTYGSEYKQKASLSQLKRLIDTIPTREEITRLKRQISAYKMNLSLANERCKELQSDNERLKHRLKDSRDEQNSLKTLYDDALKLNDDILEISEYFREQYILERLKNKKWWQIWK